MHSANDEALVAFFQDLERYTELLQNNRLRSGIFDRSYVIVGHYYEGNTVTPRYICYESSSFCRWQRFAEALSACKQRIRTFSLFRIRKLPQEIFDLLLPGLFGKNIERLNLAHCELGSEGLLFMANALRACPSLKSLSLKGNHINDDRGDEQLSAAVAEFSRAIANHPLKELDLSSCNLGENPLSALLTGAQHVSCIDLSNNPLLGTANACHAISRFLQTNPSTQRLFLKGIQLQDEGAELLAQSLRINNRLRLLDFGNNPDITYSGLKALCGALFDSSSLNAAVQSNHVCVVRHDATRDTKIAQTLQINKKLTPSQNKNRRRKMFLLLRNQINDKLNLQHFTNLPLNLMPDALQTVMSDPSEKRRLSNVFEVLPWNIPLFTFANEIS